MRVIKTDHIYINFETMNLQDNATLSVIKDDIKDFISDLDVQFEKIRNGDDEKEKHRNLYYRDRCFMVNMTSHEGKWKYIEFKYIPYKHGWDAYASNTEFDSFDEVKIKLAKFLMTEIEKCQRESREKAVKLANQVSSLMIITLQKQNQLIKSIEDHINKQTFYSWLRSFIGL